MGQLLENNYTKETSTPCNLTATSQRFFEINGHLTSIRSKGQAEEIEIVDLVDLPVISAEVCVNLSECKIK